MRQSTADVLGQGFSIAPLRMTMDMHMLGAMYGMNDSLTVMVMVPYLDLEMDLVTGMGVNFTTGSSGPGDISLNSLYRLVQSGHHTFNLNAGISVPTGSIDERDATPMGLNQPLPYPMQLGSGTWDLLPGITYTGHADDLNWGVQAAAVLRLGENDNDYTLGNRFRLTGWLGKSWTAAIISSVRMDAEWWGNIDGADSNLPAMAPMMVPTADPDLRGGRRYDVLLGTSIAPVEGALRGHRFGIEFGMPVYQNLDGPQLETDWTATLGWQLAL